MDVSKSTVCILLSTYNGQKYIREQLDSIRAQTYLNWQLLIRDDGSSDSTLEILREYALEDQRIQVSAGVNCGVVASFLSLLEGADENCGFFAFCDQDDVWLPDKLERALNCISNRGYGSPCLYCSRLTYVDSTLQAIGESPMPSRIGIENALVENIATGCTVVINAELRQMIVGRNPMNVIMHDWLCYQVAACFGVVVVDQESRILYRQHEGNVVGGTSSYIKQIRRRIVSHFTRSRKQLTMLDQACGFLECYKREIPIPVRTEIERFVSIREGVVNRLVYALTTKLRRNRPLDTFLLRLLIAAGRV